MMNKTTWLFSIGLLVIVLIFSCGEQKPPAQKSTKQVSGSRIYTQYCKQCHGSKGDLGLNGATKFKESTLTTEERVDVITNGRKTMLPYKDILNKKEIAAVAKYIETLK